MKDLSLVSDDEIWEEISKRNCSAILVTLKQYDDRREGVQVNFCGGKFTCIGLAEHCLTKILDEASNPDDDINGEA